MVLLRQIVALAVVSPVAVQGARVAADVDWGSTPCPSRDWSVTILPNVHRNLNTPWKRDQEKEYVFSLPSMEPGFFRAAIYEASCPSHARHPDGIATFNCERNGEWRMTKETCSFSNVDCFARSVMVATEDGYTHSYHFETGDAGATTSLPCNLGPWTTGDVPFICKDGDWQVDGDLHCMHTEVVEQEIVDCIAQSGYKVTIDGNTQEYSMPRGDFGQRMNQGCKFGTKTQGTVAFTCEETGNWVAVEQTCREPPVAVPHHDCGAKRKGVKLHGVLQHFLLYPGDVGSTAEVSCSNGLTGTATWECVPRKTSHRWKLISHSCTEA